MKNKYLIKNSLAQAVAAAKNAFIDGYRVVGIEAEYGDKDLADEVPGVVSLSHHGPRSSNLAPCLRWDLFNQYQDNTCFIFSHLDADSLFGLFICEGAIPDDPKIHNITDILAYMDINGPHKIHEHPLYHEYRNIITAIVMSISTHRGMLNRDAETLETIVDKLKYSINHILQNNTSEINKWVLQAKKLEQEAFDALDKNLSEQNSLHVFISYNSYAYKYVIEHDKYISYANCTIQYNTKFKTVTLACVDEDKAKQYFGEKGVLGPLKDFFGEGSGGRLAIGGSPRDKKIAFSDFLDFVTHVKNILITTQKDLNDTVSSQ